MQAFFYFAKSNMSRILSLINRKNLPKINSSNIIFAKYVCACEQHYYSIGNNNYSHENKIRICEKCNSIMHGLCIKDDNTKCVNCSNCYISNDYMCGICGEIVKCGVNYRTNTLKNENDMVYKISCNNCLKKLKPILTHFF